MSGKRLVSFRAGDRSEYLAAFGLSRVAFIYPFPRQEDFGVADFLCVLSVEDCGLAYPRSAFYVQVKANSEPVVLDRDALRWITHHMDHPLFLCFSDKSTGQLTLYSTSHLWFALFHHAEPDSVTLLPDSSSPPNHYEVATVSPPVCNVHLGPAILRQSVSELEADPTLARSVLEAWLTADAITIARRRVGRMAVTCINKWETNVVPDSSRYTNYYYDQNVEKAEGDIVPILTALAHNYRDRGEKAKLDALSTYLRQLEGLLDSHGRDLAGLSGQTR